MAISSYNEGNRELWKVYVNIRSEKDSTLRKQKRIFGITTENEARRIEKSLIKKLTQEISALDNMGAKWSRVLDEWEISIRNDPFKKYAKTTVSDYLASLRNWTQDWFNRYACTLTPGDGRAFLNHLRQSGLSYSHIKRLKNTVNLVYRWAIEEQLILGVHKSPLEGVKLEKFESEKVPEILSREQIRVLLYEAKHKKHPWYPVWAMAILTGMRNGELHALKWEKVDFSLGIMRIDSSYNTRTRETKPTTKAGYWRNVPISGELKALLSELKKETGNTDFVLPRFWQWDRGMQAKILRTFCKEIGIPSIRFHTLRACFATQLLADGVSVHKVMAVCGWRDTKTMDIYVRLAGVNITGATETLKVIPEITSERQNIVELFKN